MSNTNIYSIYKDNINIFFNNNHNYQFSSRFLEFFFFSYIFHLILLLAMEKDGWICYNEIM